MKHAKTKIAVAAVTIMLAVAGSGCAVPNGPELAEKNPLVYVADGIANLFHKSSHCKYISAENAPGVSSVIEMNLEEAAREGRMLCSHCSGNDTVQR